MIQPLAIPTRSTLLSATLIDHFFRKQFFDNRDPCVFHAGKTDNCVNFVLKCSSLVNKMMTLKFYIKLFL